MSVAWVGLWVGLRRSLGKSRERPRGAASAPSAPCPPPLRGGALQSILLVEPKLDPCFVPVAPRPSGDWVHSLPPSSLLLPTPCIWACIPFPNRFVPEPAFFPPLHFWLPPLLDTLLFIPLSYIIFPLAPSQAPLFARSRSLRPAPPLQARDVPCSPAPMVLTLLLSAYKLCRFFAMSGPRPGAERLAVPGSDVGSGAAPWWAAGGRGPREVSPGAGTEVQGALERALPELQQALSALKQAGDARTMGAGLAEVFQLVEEAWLLPAVGREVAQGLCDTIRLDGGLDLLLRLLQATELETRVQAARLLEQILVADNR